MKSIVLFLFLGLAVLSLAQVEKHPRQWGHPWLPPPQHEVHDCPYRGFVPPGWPKMHHTTFMIPPSANNDWRPNQSDQWISPFFFGFPNYFYPWGYHAQYQGGILPRFQGRPPLHPNFGQPQAPWPIHQHFGPAFRHWTMPPHISPTPVQWPAQPNLGPIHRPWSLPAHLAPIQRPWRVQPQGSILRQWSGHPHLGPAPGPWPIMPQMAPQYMSHLQHLPHMPPQYYLGV